MKEKNEEVEIFEDEKKIVLDHDYDGIRELDNPLPKWWLYTFYLTIIFAIPYYAAHTFFGAVSIHDEFKNEVDVVTKTQDEFDKKEGQFSLAEYEKVNSDPAMEKVAAKLYKRKCSTCHGKDGGGSVGPNLADNFWINGDGSLESKYDVINKGVVENGMAAWGPVLGKEKVYAVLKYIDAFRGTSPENPKAPQGKEYK